MSVYDFFVMMFYSLDHAFQKSPNEELRLYLSDLDPFIWADECSADPAEYEDLKSDFQKHGTTDAYGYVFVKDHIDRKCSGTIKAAFSTISKSAWKRAMKEYLRRKPTA